MSLRNVLKISPSTQLGIPNSPVPTWAIFEDPATGELVLGSFVWNPVEEEWYPPQTTAGLVSFGADPLAVVPLSKRHALADATNNPRGMIPSTNLAEILVFHVLGELADPTGVTHAKPVRMNRRKGGVGIWLGNYGRLHLADWERNPAQPNYRGMLDVGIADYRRMAINGTPKEVLDRIVGARMLDIFGSMRPEFRDALVPVERRSPNPENDYARPQTTITDDFNRSNDTVLGTSGEGWSWTEVDTGFAINSNRAENTEGNDGYSRAESDLSSDDHYVSADHHNEVNGSNRGCSGAVRYDSSADTNYHCRCVRLSDQLQEYLVKERTAGSNSEIASSTGHTDSPSSGNTVKVEINGSDIEVFYNGSSRVTVTDTSITGNTRTGISGRHTGTSRLRLDDFEAADLASGPTVGEFMTARQRGNIQPVQEGIQVIAY